MKKWSLIKPKWAAINIFLLNTRALFISSSSILKTTLILSTNPRFFVFLLIKKIIDNKYRSLYIDKTQEKKMIKKLLIF